MTSPTPAELEPRSITERWADQEKHFQVVRRSDASRAREAMGKHLAEMAKPGFPEDEDGGGGGGV